MGGAFASMADPFQLMYKARNDVKGLTEDLAKAAMEGATFNKETGEFELATAQMHKLRIIAEQTGLEYEDLATMGKNAAKFAKIKSQMTFDFGTGKDAEALKEFVSSTSKRLLIAF